MSTKEQTKVIAETVIKETEEGTVYLVSSIFYQLGGQSWVTYKTEPRGYYLSTRIETRSTRNGMSITSFELFTGGLKSLIEEARMFSAKKLAALEVSTPELERLASQVMFDYRERQARQAEQRAMRRA